MLILSEKTRNQCRFLEQNKNEILKRWMSSPDVKATFQKHKITTEFFGKYFATKVIDYAFGVINNVNKLGDCPVISVMLAFFKKKNFSLSDVFKICVNFKNSLNTYALESNILDIELLTAINTLIDHNFMGVMNEYISLHYFPSENKNCNFKDDQTVFCTTIPPVRDDIPKQTISAKDYLAEIETDNLLMDELAEIEEEALDSFDLSDSLSSNRLDQVVSLFEKYEKMLHQLLDFEEIDYALSLLNDLLRNVSIEILNESSTFIPVYIKAIIGDLTAWRKSVFIHQNAEDIHYLDKTLLSSIAQLQILLSPQQEIETADIEFF